MLGRAMQSITTMMPVRQCGHSRNDCPVNTSKRSRWSAGGLASGLGGAIPSNSRQRSSFRERWHRSTVEAGYQNTKEFSIRFAALKARSAAQVVGFNGIALAIGEGRGRGTVPTSVFAVTTPQGTAGGHCIYLAGEIVDVLLNAQSWNREVEVPLGRQQWGRRRVQYFVGVPYSGEFAPCKFCAFLPIIQAGRSSPGVESSRMTLQLYIQLDESEPRFDGNVAQRHLTNRLGMVRITPTEHPRTAEQFEHWLNTVRDLITVPASGPIILLPPET